MQTIRLENLTWDLSVDADGNIAVAADAADRPSAVAQDVASAARLFSGELWYDASQGIPFFSRVMGRPPPVALLKAYFVKAAKTVPGVVTASCFISSIFGRKVVGQIQITDVVGVAATVEL